MAVQEVELEKAANTEKPLGPGRAKGEATQAKRIVRLLMLLQVPGSQETIETLAKYFHVSLRTITRDLRALRGAGAQIVTERTVLRYVPPMNLTTRQAAALGLLKSLLTERPSARLVVAVAWLTGGTTTRQNVRAVLQNVSHQGDSPELCELINEILKENEASNGDTGIP